AAIDGASRWRAFRDITLPLLKPIYVIVISLSIIWDFQVFNQVWLITNTTPSPDYYVMAVYSYVTSFKISEYGLGSSIAVWMVATAFKPGSDIIANTPVWFPTHPTLSNFSDAIHRPYFWTSVRNSLIVVVSVVVISLVLAFLAALALAKFRFYGRKTFIALIIGVQMVPLNALIIPIYLVLSKAHQVDKLSGLVITYLTFVLPFTIWTLRGFLLGVPRELVEAAQVDGSTRFGALVRIRLPLIGPGTVA